jgi:hypothetical protein
LGTNCYCIFIVGLVFCVKNFHVVNLVPHVLRHRLPLSFEINKNYGKQH